MEKSMLQPLTEQEKKFAEENHNLVYDFLHKRNYNVEDFYSIVIFGYLKAVQMYQRRKSLQEKCGFSVIAFQYMHAEIQMHFRAVDSQKRKPTESIISLDDGNEEGDNLYNVAVGESFESDVMEKELIKELMENLSEDQRKIAKLKMDGYSNKEVYMLLEIKPSTYYKKIKRIRAIVEVVLES